MANNDVKNLIKILIGAAWLDGKVQPEELRYINQIAVENGVATEPEIQPLLNQLRMVQPLECYTWVREYLGNHPQPEDSQILIEAISGLIYSDDDVAIAEAKLLVELQSLDSDSQLIQPGHSGVLKDIQSLYRRWVDRLS